MLHFECRINHSLPDRGVLFSTGIVFSYSFYGDRSGESSSMVAKTASIRPLLQINFGSPAKATDDTLGKVTQVLVDPAKWQISYVVVQRGMFAKKLLVLPIELVSEARVDGLEFSLTVDDLLQKAQTPKANVLLLKEHLPVGNG